MRRFTKPVVAGSTITAFYLIGVAMGSRQTAVRAADGGPAVTIASPLPLPVSGTVSAQQSGPWNAVITGTPNVNVTGLPAVNLASGASVNVADDPGRIPYQSTVDNTGKCFGSNQPCFFEFGTAPAGHRLVIQHISGLLVFKSVPTYIQVSNSSFSKAFFAPTIPLVLVSAFDKDIQLYLDGGSQIEFEVVSDALFNNSSGTLQPLTLTGYLLDCIAAQCAPIAH